MTVGLIIKTSGLII